ncbi:MAG: UbiA family prenyltransferase, partial [Planctomycetota bacterium]
LIGWTAASPTPIADMSTLPPWSIFLILAVWQIPHFTAIAMMYREQYRGAGFKPLPDAMHSVEAGRMVLVWAALTVMVSALPLVAMPQLVGVMYTIMAASMGAIFIYAAAMLAQQPTTDLARKVFLWSIAYLPIVYLALVVDVLLPVRIEPV